MTPYPPIQVQKKRGMGCVGCGCTVVAVLVVLLLALLGASTYYLYSAAGGYTDTVASALPQFDGGPNVLQTARQKIDTFEEALEHGQAAALHLNSDEINTLIAEDPSYAAIKGHLFVTLKGDAATIESSLPLSSIESVIYSDRFLNGTATFGLHFDPLDKSLNLDLHSVRLKDRDLPADFYDSFDKTFNPMFNQRLQANPAVRDFLNRVQKVTIENGELVIVTK